jgi:hypothetical protein
VNNPNQEPASTPTPPENTPGSQPAETPPQYHDWREQRRAERLARRQQRWERRSGRHYGWIAGVMLILLGGIFLLQNMGYMSMTNWWALFILIPAFFMFIAAWESYQVNDRLTRGGAFSLAWGCIFTFIALVFLLNIDLGLFWPLLLIAGGVVFLLTAFLAS